MRSVPTFPCSTRDAVARKRARWQALKSRLDADRLVFVDETWIKTDMAPLRGWAQSSSLRCAVETPWASGDMQRDQGVGRDGPPWIRAHLIQMAWRRMRHRPDSPLSKWFERRTAGAKGRIRKVMIIALARKLLIALWRFFGSVTTEARAGAGDDPAGQRTAQALAALHRARPCQALDRRPPHHHSVADFGV